MFSPKAWEAVARLRAELAWLKREHPDRTALIACVEGQLRTIDDAGSVRGFSVVSEGY